MKREPRHDTTAFFICCMLRGYPAAPYRVIRKKLLKDDVHTSLAYIREVAGRYSLRRGHFYEPGVKMEMIRLIMTTSLSYAEIGRLVGINPNSVSNFATRHGIHDPKRRNKRPTVYRVPHPWSHSWAMPHE